MAWRSSTTMQDRILASLPYLIPMLEVLEFGMLVFTLLPQLMWLFLPLFFLTPLYFYSVGGLAIVEMAVFFGLFILVVRNYQLPHFLRFNTLQALLISIFAYLCRLVLSLLGMTQSALSPIGGSGVSNGGDLTLQVLFTLIFLGGTGAAIYAIVQCLRGRYAEIPMISEAVYTQVR